MAVDGMFGGSVELLSTSVDLRARNHNYLAGNLANAETPGYAPRVLQFEDQLRQAVQRTETPVSPVMTNPRHIPLTGVVTSVGAVEGEVVESPASTIGRDGNGVELDREMASLAENQIMFNASIDLLRKKFDTLKLAIKGGN
jgi:flagellar basal-body rod protein FlgB